MTGMWLAGKLFAMLLAPLLLAGAFSAPAQAAVLWGGCAQFLGDRPLIATAQCGTVDVSGARLAVIRVPASGERIGTLMVNPGGPGASAVDTVADMGTALADTEIGRRFDLVGFDPRGVGHSTPALRCRSDADVDAYRRDPMVDYSPAGVAHIEDVYRWFGQACLDAMGADFLASVGTDTAAADMDAVRAALGDEQISYLGFSYGTELGTAYAERFPDRVRAMVLDGALDPAADPIDENVAQLAGFQGVFDEYAADCARSPACPLGTDPTQFVARYHQLIDPLVTRPAATTDPRGLSYSDAITGTANALYAKRYWPYLTSGLLGLQRGTDPGDLLMLADDYLGRDAAGHYRNQQDAFTAIRCVDARYSPDPAVWVDADRRTRAAAPFMEYGTFTGHAPRDICALWPVPATRDARAAVSPGPGKVIVVSTTRDPATPYAAGVNLARQLQAPLVTFDGSQHTVVFNGDACVDTTVLAFLTDLAQPAPGLTC